MTQEFLTEVLESFYDQDKLNYWFYELGKPFYEGKILEIGSGFGRLSEFFLNDKYNITLSEYDPKYLNILKSKFSNYIHNIYQIDLLDNNIASEHLEVYDTVFSSDVIEHIENHDLAIQNMAKLLKEKGKLITIVPANQLLFSEFDRKIGHYRRYSQKSLNQLLINNGFEPIYSQYFNTLGALSSFICRKLFKKTRLNKSMLSSFNQLVGIAKILDKIAYYKFGNHLFSVAIKV